MSDIEIKVEEIPYDSHSRLFELTADHGFANVTLNRQGWLGIANVDVERGYRRRGIGKALLAETVNLANELDARYIYADIVSRESILAFKQIFGEESVNVKDLDSFTQEGEADRYNASAKLWYEVAEST